MTNGTNDNGGGCQRKWAAATHIYSLIALEPASTELAATRKTNATVATATADAVPATCRGRGGHRQKAPRSGWIARSDLLMQTSFEAGPVTGPDDARSAEAGLSFRLFIACVYTSASFHMYSQCSLSARAHVHVLNLFFAAGPIFHLYLSHSPPVGTATAKLPRPGKGAHLRRLGRRLQLHGGLCQRKVGRAVPAPMPPTCFRSRCRRMGFRRHRRGWKRKRSWADCHPTPAEAQC